jgi:hypothetical protein
LTIEPRFEDSLPELVSMFWDLVVTLHAASLRTLEVKAGDNVLWCIQKETLPALALCQQLHILGGSLQMDEAAPEPSESGADSETGTVDDDDDFGETAPLEVGPGYDDVAKSPPNPSGLESNSFGGIADAKVLGETGSTDLGPDLQTENDSNSDADVVTNVYDRRMVSLSPSCFR